MKQKDKELLLIDLCARLPYKVKVCLYKKETCILTGIDGHEVYLNVDSDSFRIESIKPYLRPMSSMTDNEKEEFENLLEGIVDGIERWDKPDMCEEYDWLNAHHFDYRDLISKGLAIEASEVMYRHFGDMDVVITSVEYKDKL